MAASNRSAFLARLSSDTIINILGIIQGIILVPLYLKYVSADVYGAWLASGSIVAHLGMFDFGLNSVLLQRLSVAAGAQDKHAIGRLLMGGIVILFLVSVISMIAALVIVKYLYVLVNIHHSLPQIGRAFIWAALASSIMLMNYGLSSLFIANKQNVFQGVALIISTLLGIVVTVVTLLSNYGIESIALGWLARSLVYFGILLVGVFLYAARNRLQSELRIERSTLRDLLANSGIYSFSRMARVITSKADNIIIANIIGPEATTVYVLTTKLAATAATFLDRVGGSLMPFIANSKGAKDRAAVNRYISVSFIGLLKISAVVFAMIVIFNKDIMRYWVGAGFYVGDGFNILAGIFFLIYVSYIASIQNLLAVGLIKQLSTINIIEVVLKIVLGVSLCYKFGLSGLLIGTMISVLVPYAMVYSRLKSESITLRLIAKHVALRSLLVDGLLVAVFLHLTRSWPDVGLGVVIGGIALVGIFISLLNYVADRRFFNGVISTFLPRRRPAL